MVGPGVMAGSLVHRVDIEYISDTTAADSGHGVPTWSVKVANVPCEIMHQAGGEFDRGGQVEPRSDVVIRIRHPGDDKYPTPEMRCVTKHLTPAATYNIVYVQRADPRGRELHLHCKHVVAT